MKTIPCNTPHILIRYANYEKYDFIEEHLKIIKEYGYTWLLKSGRNINVSFISEVFDNEGGLILKSPVKSGDSYYYCKLEKTDKKPDKYPEYYNDLIYEYNKNTLDEAGTWLRIKSIQKINKEAMNKFVVIKTGKSILETIGKTRTAVMFVKNKCDIII